MKTLIYNTIVALLLMGASALGAQEWQQERLGLPGDNLNLFAVMSLFQDSETLEAFERDLNDPERMINNLDLKGNNLVDYIMVFDYARDNLHNIVLRVSVDRDEYQDVAVFIVEQYDDGSVLIQLIGDEALYGPDYIVEPNYAERLNPGFQGAMAQNEVSAHTVTYYEVAQWPVIVYMYEPTYVVWHSRWHWGYYPSYWSPWTPHYWHYYHGYHYSWNSYYYAYYRPWRHHRSNSYRNVYYTSIRINSPTVVVNINNGRYRRTYTRPETVREGQRLHAQRHPNGGEARQRRRSEASASINSDRQNNSPSRNRVEQQARTPHSRNSASVERSSRQSVRTTENRNRLVGYTRDSQTNPSNRTTAPARQSTVRPQENSRPVREPNVSTSRTNQSSRATTTVDRGNSRQNATSTSRPSSSATARPSVSRPQSSGSSNRTSSSVSTSTPSRQSSGSRPASNVSTPTQSRQSSGSRPSSNVNSTSQSRPSSSTRVNSTQSNSSNSRNDNSQSSNSRSNSRR